MAENLDCSNLTSQRPLFSGWKVTRYDSRYPLFIVVHSFFKAARFEKAKVSAVAVMADLGAHTYSRYARPLASGNY